MIKLYGLKFSNYYGLTKAALIEKGVEFEEIKAPPTQKEDNLSRSPMGKMPSIEVDGRFLSESFAIVHYLEAIAPEPRLIPEDPFEAAKVREICLHAKLDIDLVARRLLPQVLFDQPVSDETKEQVAADLEKGQGAMDRIFVGGPFAAGDAFTLADLYINYSYTFAQGMAKAVLDVDLLGRQPGVAKLVGELAERPSIARVAADAAG